MPSGFAVFPFIVLLLVACGPSTGSDADGEGPDGPGTPGASEVPEAPDGPEAPAAPGTPDVPEARLRIDGDPAGPDSVILVLENHASTALGYNLCTTWLERRVEAGWETVPSDRACTMELRILPGGEVAHHAREPAPDLEPGEYRYVTGVEWQEAGEMVEVPSRSFEVAGQP